MGISLTIDSITAGVKNADENELRSIASDPDSIHMYNVADFSFLLDIVDSLTDNLCNSVKGPGMFEFRSDQILSLHSQTFDKQCIHSVQHRTQSDMSGPPWKATLDEDYQPSLWKLLQNYYLKETVCCLIKLESSYWRRTSWGGCFFAVSISTLQSQVLFGLATTEACCVFQPLPSLYFDLSYVTQ